MQDFTFVHDQRKEILDVVTQLLHHTIIVYISVCCICFCACKILSSIFEMTEK